MTEKKDRFITDVQVEKVIESTLICNALKEKTINRIIARYHDYSVLGCDLIAPFKSFSELHKFIVLEIKELNAVIVNSCSQEQRDYLLARRQRLLSLDFYLYSKNKNQ